MIEKLRKQIEDSYYWDARVKELELLLCQDLVQIKMRSSAS